MNSRLKLYEKSPTLNRKVCISDFISMSHISLSIGQDAYYNQLGFQDFPYRGSLLLAMGDSMYVCICFRCSPNLRLRNQ